MLAAEMAARADAPNISYFAFTATPEGQDAGAVRPQARRRTANCREPFHVYTMQQAIEEGFILDVLQELHALQASRSSSPHNGQEYDDRRDGRSKSQARQGPDAVGAAAPDNIARRSQIIVEHFRANVAPAARTATPRRWS